MRGALNRWAGVAALLIALLAFVLATTSDAGAGRTPVGSVVRLDRHGKVPARLLPVVPRARRAARLGRATADDLRGSCSPDTVDLGTWCLWSSAYSPIPDEIGRTDYAFATAKCVALGGWLPTAAELIGAASRVKLASTIDDSPLTASIDEEPGDGLKDKREMSATLVTTAGGSSAAGSEGVTEGSRGDPRQGEPDPVPMPANPYPDTLQYVTVYDNHEQGGFAGSKPVGQSESFRCAFAKIAGASRTHIG